MIYVEFYLFWVAHSAPGNSMKFQETLSAKRNFFRKILIAHLWSGVVKKLRENKTQIFTPRPLNSRHAPATQLRWSDHPPP